MVRTYKRKTDRTERSAENVQQLHKAVRAVRKGQSFRKVAEEFGLKTSSLWRAVRKDGEGKKLASYSEMSQSRLIFTIEEEAELVQYLLTTSRIGFPLDTATLTHITHERPLAAAILPQPNTHDRPLAAEKHTRCCGPPCLFTPFYSREILS